MNLKVIVAGSRSIKDYEKVKKAIEEVDWLTKAKDIDKMFELVSGGADGVDKLGESYARENGIPIERFEAEWDKHGKRAGPLRNGKMAEYADALIAVWDGESTGTDSMINLALKNGLDTHIKIFPEEQV